MVLGLGLLKKGVIGGACAANGVLKAVTGAAVGTVGAALGAAKAVVTGNGKSEEMGVSAAQNSELVVGFPAKRVICLAAAAALVPLASGSPILYLGAVPAAMALLMRKEKKDVAKPSRTSEPLQLQILVAAVKNQEVTYEAAESVIGAEEPAVIKAAGVPEPAELSAAAPEGVAAEEAEPEVDAQLESRGRSYKRESQSERGLVVSEQVKLEALSASEGRSSGTVSAAEATGEQIGVNATALEESPVESYPSEVKEILAEESEKVKGVEMEGILEMEVEPEGFQFESEAGTEEVNEMQEVEIEPGCEPDERAKEEEVMVEGEQEHGPQGGAVELEVQPEGCQNEYETEAEEVTDAQGLEVEPSCQLNEDAEGEEGMMEEGEEIEPSSGEQGEQEEANESEPEGGEAQGRSTVTSNTKEQDVDEMPTLLAQGAYGKVYRQGSKALKVVQNDDGRMQREFQFMSCLGAECDNILCAWGFVCQGKLSCYQMPLCKLSSCDLLRAYQKIYNKPGLPEKWVLHILMQAAEALRVCHEFGVCHFDVKPANILLTQAPTNEQAGLAEGTVKLCDFGEAIDEERLEEVTRSIGTEYYMAPEMRALDQKSEEPAVPVGPACDMYSLGVTAVVLLDGGMETGLPWVHEFTRDLVNLLLQEDPSQRITAEEFLDSELLINHPLLL